MENTNKLKSKDLFLVERMSSHDRSEKAFYVNRNSSLPIKGREYEGPASICKGATKKNVTFRSEPLSCTMLLGEQHMHKGWVSPLYQSPLPHEKIYFFKGAFHEKGCCVKREHKEAPLQDKAFSSFLVHLLLAG